jgi:hypothetical protein
LRTLSSSCCCLFAGAYLDFGIAVYEHASAMDVPLCLADSVLVVLLPCCWCLT